MDITAKIRNLVFKVFDPIEQWLTKRYFSPYTLPNGLTWFFLDKVIGITNWATHHQRST